MELNSVLIVALVSTIAFFCYFLIGAGDSEPSADAGGEHGSSGWSILQFISIQFVLLSVMSYSWSWLFFSHRVEGAIPQIFSTVTVGTAMVVLYLMLMRGIRRLNTPEAGGFIPEVGMMATVYSRIPARGKALGMVTFLDRRFGDVMMDATTQSETDIPNGSNVIVEQVGPRAVVVRPAK